jgi:hypothetical protein
MRAPRIAPKSDAATEGAIRLFGLQTLAAPQVFYRDASSKSSTDVVQILLWSAANYICVHEEDEDFLKAAKILHSMTRKLTKARWGVTLDGEVQDLSTGEKLSPTRQ